VRYLQHVYYKDVSMKPFVWGCSRRAYLPGSVAVHMLIGPQIPKGICYELVVEACVVLSWNEPTHTYDTIDGFSHSKWYFGAHHDLTLRYH
jgi:hypothetical protein